MLDYITLSAKYFCEVICLSFLSLFFIFLMKVVELGPQE